MSKRRGEVQNWYILGFEARAKMMSEHGVVGRSYHGRVTQVISGSIGFDDFEWGVDLYADDPLVFKKLIYEMRFDEASARYGEFGPFWAGLQFSPRRVRASSSTATRSRSSTLSKSLAPARERQSVYGPLPSGIGRPTRPLSDVEQHARVVAMRYDRRDACRCDVIAMPYGAPPTSIGGAAVLGTDRSA